MGDEDERGLQALLEVLHLDLHLLPELQVQGRHGLVEKQHLGLQHHGPGQGHALLLPAGELVDAAVPEAGRRTISRAFTTRAGISAWGQRPVSRPKATLPATVRWGKSAYCWKTVLTGRL